MGFIIDRGLHPTGLLSYSSSETDYIHGTGELVSLKETLVHRICKTVENGPLYRMFGPILSTEKCVVLLLVRVLPSWRFQGDFKRFLTTMPHNFCPVPGQSRGRDVVIKRLLRLFIDLLICCCP